MEKFVTPLDAVRYALKTSAGPHDWPRLILIDKDNKPLSRGKAGAGFVYVTRRAGDPAPTQADITTAEASKKAAEDLGRKFVDYIIIGTGYYYSFARERRFTLMRSGD